MADRNDTTILLVEDEALIAMVEKQQLEKEGYRVLYAPSGEKAVEIVCTNSMPVDLILMDINLGSGMDGTQAARKIIGMHDIPVIFLSSHTEKETVEKTEEITSYGYVVKNSDPTVLFASIRMAFRLHKANMQLRESEEKYRSLFENAPIGIFRTNTRGQALSVNTSMARILRLNTPQEAIERYTDLGKQLYVDSGRRDQFLKLLQTEGYVENFEYEARTADGRNIWLSMNARMRLDDRGGPVIEGFTIDITDRKRAAEELKEPERRYNTLIENLPGFVYRCRNDRQWTMEYISAGCIKVTGYRPEDFIHNHRLAYNDILMPEYVEPIWQKWQECLITRVPFEAEYQIRTAAGEIKWVWERGRGVFDDNGQLLFLEGYIEDITGRKQIEDSLRERSEQFRSLFENNHAVMLLIDPHSGAIVDSNPAAANFYGWSHDELNEKNISEINTLTPEEVSREMQAARKMQRNYFLFRHRRADGSIRDVEVYSGPIRVGGRELLYSIIYDITERRRAEEKIQNLLHEKELLLKEVHHRVINNMNTIYSLIRLQFEAQADPAVKMALQDAASRLQSMMVLYDKLYRSKIPKAVSIRDYFPPLLNEIVGIFPHAGTIGIKTQIDDIVLDPYLLSPLGIILAELITNAMKHAFKGRSDGVITVTASKKENDVSITFEDNGIGLPDSITFENSSGFGMQLVGMLVQQIDGTITIIRNRGTKFIIKFSPMS